MQKFLAPFLKVLWLRMSISDAHRGPAAYHTKLSMDKARVVRRWLIWIYLGNELVEQG
ncbi:unnamed protein product, partial [Amoebophrya sp. A25]